MNYTWKQFIEAVREQLPVDEKRRGFGVNPTGGISALEVQARNAISDLQYHIPGLRLGHSTVYEPEDFIVKGSAAYAELPLFSRIRTNGVRLKTAATEGEVSIAAGVITFTGVLQSSATIDGEFTDVEGAVSPYTIPVGTSAFYSSIIPADNCKSMPFRQYPWAHSEDMECGIAEAVLPTKGCGCTGYIAIAPDGAQFAVTPVVTDGYVLEIEWDSIGQSGKMTFQPEDMVPFNDMVVQAVALFLEAYIARKINQNQPMAEAYAKDYALKRRDCFVDYKTRTEAANSPSPSSGAGYYMTCGS